MAAYDFPDTAGKPTDGSFQYTAPDGTLYEWNGYAWTVPPGEGGGGSGGGDFEVPTQALPPSGAVDGDMFWCTDDGRLYIYYEDADTSQWVDASPDNTSEAVDSYWAKSGSTLSPIDAADSVDIGSGNITLNVNGVGVFENVVQSGKNPAGAAGQGTRLTPTGVILATRDDADEQVFAGYTTGNSLATSSLNADGSSQFAGDMAIGTTGSFTPSTPAISLKATGTAQFKSNVTVNNEVILDAAGTRLIVGNSGFNSGLDSNTTVGTTGLTVSFDAADVTNGTAGVVIRDAPASKDVIKLNASGSASFAGQIDAQRGIFTDAPGNLAIRTVNSSTNKQNFGASSSGVSIGDDISTADGNKITLNADGSAIFKGAVQVAGGVVTPSAVLQLEADDDTKYTSTTDSEGNETRVYNGTVLDVKDRIQNLIARIDAIEANEVTDDATDSALLTLVASLSSRLDERDATIAALTTRISTLEIQSNGGNS